MAEVCYNQPDPAYRKEEGENQSSLKKILISPAHYQAAKKQKLMPTPAMEIGTALHCLLLDGPEAFERAYVRKPDGINLSTKAGKAWKAENAKKKVLTCGGKEDAWNSVQGMAASLRQLLWFSGTDKESIKYNEVSIYWDWEGVRCKARLDRVLVEEGILLDLKSTDAVELELFNKKVVGLGYEFQAAFYREAAKQAYGRDFRFIFAGAERNAPYTVDLFEPDDEMYSEGHARCITALRLLKSCQEANHWPNREPKLHKLSLPAWYERSVQQSAAKAEQPTEDLF